MVENTHWDLLARRYDQIMGREGGVHHKNTIVPAIFNFLGDVRGKRILDLACGQGYLSQRLAESGAEVIGIDLSAELLKIAKKYEEEKKNGVIYLHRNAADLHGISKNSFDLIVCNMALHDIEDLSSTVKECSRVLKTDGLLVFSILHPLADGLRSGEAEKDHLGPFIRLRRYNKAHKLPHRAYHVYGISLYHRPLDHYFNELFANGFSVCGFRELSVKQNPAYLGASFLKRALLFVKSALLPARRESGKNEMNRPPSWALEIWGEIPLFAVVAARKIR